MQKKANKLCLKIFNLIFLSITFISLNAGAELLSKLKFPLDKSKNYEFTNPPPPYCTNKSDANKVCFTNIDDYKLLCNKIDSVSNFSVKMFAQVKKDGDIIFENDGFKSLEINWDDSSKKCIAKMRFAGMVKGTDMNYKVKGYINEFILNDKGEAFGLAHPDYNQ